jgi:hypothetical protein
MFAKRTRRATIAPVTATLAAAAVPATSSAASPGCDALCETGKYLGDSGYHRAAPAVSGLWEKAGCGSLIVV